MKNVSLRGRVQLAMVVIAMIPLLLLGYTEYLNAERFYQETYEMNVQTFQQDVGTKLNDHFAHSMSEVLLTHDVIKTVLQGGDGPDAIDGLAVQMGHYIRRYTQYDQIRLLDQTGMEVLRVNNVAGSPVRVPTDQLQDKSDRYYFTEAQKLIGDQVYISDLDLNIEYGVIERPFKAMIRYVVPIHYGEDKKMYLVLNQNVSEYLDVLRQHMEASPFGESYLVDEEGFYILHKNEEKEWGQEHILNTGYRVQSEFGKEGEGVLTAAEPQTVRSGSRMVSYQPFRIRGLYDLRLNIVTVEDQEKVFLPLAGFIQQLTIQLIVTVALVLVAATFVARYLTQPIEQVALAVDEITRGNLQTSIAIEGSKEIQMLGYEIKKMAFELDLMYRDMNQRVEERTQELKLAHDKMKEMANTDPLTNVFNRHYFNTYIEEFKREKRHQNMGLIMLDVDRFKYINDHYGHNVGDVILVEVSKMLKRETRPNDFVVRYGGDEFLIVLDNGDQVAIDSYVGRIKASLDHWNLSSDHLDHPLEFSIGCDVLQRGGHIMDVINMADTRMYEDKMSRRKERE